jgi:hypothetical protein
MRVAALLFLSFWIGAILFFSMMAPQFFASLTYAPGGRQMAVEIVGRSLSSLHTLGLALGVAFVITATVARKQVGRRRHSLKLAVALVILMLGLTAFSQFYVTPRIRSLRSDAGVTTMTELPETDARRRTFERWHRSSTTLEALTFLLGVAAFIAAAREGN